VKQVLDVSHFILFLGAGRISGKLREHYRQRPTNVLW